MIEQGTSAVVLLVKSGFGNFGILGRYKFPLNPSFIGFGMVSINAFSFSGCSNLITCTVVAFSVLSNDSVGWSILFCLLYFITHLMAQWVELEVEKSRTESMSVRDHLT